MTITCFFGSFCWGKKMKITFHLLIPKIQTANFFAEWWTICVNSCCCRNGREKKKNRDPMTAWLAVDLKFNLKAKQTLFNWNDWTFNNLAPLYALISLANCFEERKKKINLLSLHPFPMYQINKLKAKKKISNNFSWTVKYRRKLTRAISFSMN